MVTYAKVSPTMVNPRYGWGTQTKKKKLQKYCAVRKLQPPELFGLGFGAVFSVSVVSG